MNRQESTSRTGWRKQVEAQGYLWHSEGGGCSWGEDAVYCLSRKEIDSLERCANEIHGLFQEAAGHVVRHGLWHRLGISPRHAALLENSFERGELPLVGRFDFLFDESGQLKLLEYNADGALTLLETALIQRDWQRELQPGASQFNRLEEELISAWQQQGFKHVHCAWRPRHREIEGTIRYMAGLIRKAGSEATMMALHCVGWDRREHGFVDGDGRKLECCYKLYPWAWMLDEQFSEYLARSSCRFVEPPWSHLLASKGMLSLLWELFPEHPGLLACYDSPSASSETFVSKPLFGREGHNVTIYRNGTILAHSRGDFGTAPCVHQRYVRTPRFDGVMAQMGVWMVNGKAAALGIRETSGQIVNHDSRFVPHVISE